MKRNKLDQYYTKQKISDYLVEVINKKYPFKDFDLVIEPSAGEGVFIKSIDSIDSIDSKKGVKLVSYDIEPKHSDIIKQDFLKEFELPMNKYKNCLIFGNPPFGRQSSTAKKFIKKSCKLANVIAFILPRSFKKDSMTSCFDMYFHKKFEEDLKDNSFIYNGKECNIPCVFQIWEKLDHTRPPKVVLKENENYLLVKRGNKPDLAFKRVGCKAGLFINKGISSLSEQSHYFIKINKKETDCLTSLFSLAKLNSLVWEENNTVGPKSISKQELIKELNNIGSKK